MFNDKDQNQQLKYTRRHITKLQINKPVVRLHEWTHQPLNYRSTRRFEQDHGWPTDAVGAERRTTDAPRMLRTAEPRMPHGCYAQQNHGCPTDATHSRTTDDPRMRLDCWPRMTHGCSLDEQLIRRRSDDSYNTFGNQDNQNRNYWKRNRNNVNN